MINLHAPSRMRTILEVVYWFLVLVCVLILGVGIWFIWHWVMLLGVISLVVLLYGGFVEPRLVRTTRYTLGVAEEEQAPTRLIFLSDFHVGLKKQRGYYQRIANQVQALKPDIVVFGGDVVDESAHAIEAFEPLTRIVAPQGCWFVLGNHDFLDDPAFVVRWLTKQGCRNLTCCRSS